MNKEQINNINKVFICPGFIESKYDQDIHYIGLGKLLSLYRIKPYHNYSILMQSNRIGISIELDVIYLAPCYNSTDYNITSTELNEQVVKVLNSPNPRLKQML